MIQFDFFEFMYDYFIIVFWLAIGCILFVLGFTGWIIKHQIGTRVLVVRKTTAQIMKAQESIGKGIVKIGKRIYKRNGDPVFMSSLLRPYRMYLHQEDSEEVVSLTKYMKPKDEEDDSDKEDTISTSAFQDILENEVITASIKGLVGSVLEKLIYFCAGGGIFILVWEILKGVFT